MKKNAKSHEIVKKQLFLRRYATLCIFYCDSFFRVYLICKYEYINFQICTLQDKRQLCMFILITLGN